METIFDITIKFLQFLCWLLEQGTWGLIAYLVIMLSLFCLGVYFWYCIAKWSSTGRSLWWFKD
jgi:hypothetical protein